MKNLFDRAAMEESLARVDRLQSSSQRQWGKMDVAQMMAHCSTAIEMASGKIKPKRMFIGRLIGPIFRSHLINEKPLQRNSPTTPDLKIADACDFAREQQRLKQCVREFCDGGEAQCTTHPHPFFGPLTPQQWARGMYKHLDHHLQQFGV